jgi:peptide/nickel transport system permease protein
MAVPMFLARRVMAAAAVLVGVSFLIFVLLAIAPGSTTDALLGTKPRTPEAIQEITAQYHLNDPLLVQYWHWFSGLLTGDLGRSIQKDQTVTGVLAEALPATLEVAGSALAVVLVIGVTAGFVAGVRRGGWLDRSVSVLSVVALSAPPFAIGILLIYIFGVKLAWLPVFGGGNGFADRVSHLVLPVVTLVVGLVALVVRQTRAAVRDVMDQDYVVFARARGVASSRIIIGYALRTSSLPIVTVAGLLAIGTVSGTVIVETVFAVPGIGSLLINAIQNKDIPVAQGVALTIALAVVLINVAVDMMVLFLDPRTRHPVGM